MDFNVFSKELMYPDLQSTNCAVNKSESQVQLACNSTKITDKCKREKLEMLKDSNQLNIEDPKVPPLFSKPVEEPYFFAHQRFFNKESELISTSCPAKFSTDSSAFLAVDSVDLRKKTNMR